jgi:hypothetical protein
MSLYEETRAAMGGFDPFARRPETEYDEWGDLIPPPSLTELAVTLAEGGGLDITQEWLLASAALTMRYIKARDDTETFAAIEVEDDPPVRSEGGVE